MRLTAGSLFDGIGCFSLAFVRAGFDLRWTVEIDPECRRATRERFPGVRQYEDVRDVGGDNLESVDVVLGGFPCQDLSVAGRRLGLAGERSGLWSEFRRVLTEITPRWVLVENVPGLLSSNAGRDMGALLWQMGQLGYWWAYRVLDAQYDGLAQRRKRVFIVARLGDRGGLAGAASGQDAGRLRGLPCRVLFEPESVFWDYPPRRGSEQEVAGTLGSGAAGSGWRADLDRAGDEGAGTVYQANGAGSERTITDEGGPPAIAYGFVKASQKAKASEGVTEECSPPLFGGGHNNLVAAPEPIGFYPTGGSHGVSAGEGTSPAVKVGSNIGLDSAPAIAYTIENSTTEVVGFHATQDPISGSVAPAISKGCEKGCGTAAVAYNVISLAQEGSNHAYETDVSGCLQHKGLKPTGNEAGTTMVPASQMTVRRLTPVECLRLQGLPDDWLDVEPPLSDSAKYRMIGNGGSVPTVLWIARRIAAAERGEL